MVAEAKLKPCPFCGGKCSDPERQIRRPGISERPSWKIGCGAMFCFEMYRKSKKEAILAWNNRFPPSNQPGFDEMYEARMPLWIAVLALCWMYICNKMD
jgi:hypothetical protein